MTELTERLLQERFQAEVAQHRAYLRDAQHHAAWCLLRQGFDRCHAALLKVSDPDADDIITTLIRGAVLPDAKAAEERIDDVRKRADAAARGGPPRPLCSDSCLRRELPVWRDILGGTIQVRQCGCGC